ncbi:MAG: PKD domain-containing protein, partial [Bacteroidia bacterium]
MNLISRIFCASLIMISVFAEAQKEGNNWYFGTNAGITFNAGAPTAITNGQIATNDGCAAISTSKGRILFYTDGVTVWDSTHSITPNGTGLLGHRSSTQSGVIVPRPETPGQYFIFTVDYEANSNGLRYSEFDMKLNGGKGDLVATRKNIKLLSPTCEKVTSVKHIGEVNFWVLTHKFNSDSIYAYLVTSNGVNATPVISKTGFNIAGSLSNTNGYMKASPNGTKIAYANSTLGLAAIGDFNNSTGKVTNVWSFGLPTSYGVEFSPSSTFLYITSEKSKEVYQFDVSKTTQSSFVASKVVVDNDASAPSVGALQLGPDGKIYIARVGKAFLSVINSPDLPGTACNVQNDAVSLSGKLCFWGLPTFIQSFFIENRAFFSNNCVNDSTLFYPLITAGIDSMKWDFGDMASGSDNYSKVRTKVYHVYQKTGTYKVKLITFFKSNNDTTLIDVPIKNPKPFIGTDAVYCNNFVKALSPDKDYLQYVWSPTNETKKIIIVNKIGTYILKAMDSLGCWVKDTIVIAKKGNVVKPSFVSSDTAMCLTNNIYKLTNNSTFNNDSLKSVVWKFSDNTQYTDTVISKTFQTSGTFNVNLVATSKSDCKDSIRKNLVVYPKPTPSFVINENPQLFDSHNFSFTNTSKIKSGSIVSHTWNFGDGSLSTDPNISSKKYVKDTSYIISLLTISDKNCRDSVSQQVYFYVELVFNMPNAFSPNNDLSNDIFKPIFVGEIRSYHLEIFNRWGEKVFETNDINKGWDGKYKEMDCPFGIYNSILKVVSLNGEKLNYKTEIMLL